MSSLANVITMTSTEIAEMTGKTKSHVHRDIREIINTISDNPDMQEMSIVEELSHNKSVKQYHLDEEAANILVTGYDLERRMVIIRRFTELKAMATAVTAGATDARALASQQVLKDAIDAGQPARVIRKVYDQAVNMEETTQYLLEASTTVRMDKEVRHRILNSMHYALESSFNRKVMAAMTSGGSLAILESDYKGAYGMITDREKRIARLHASTAQNTVADMEWAVGELEDTVAELIDDRPTMEFMIPLHGYSVNQMYQHDGSRNVKGKSRTPGYNYWIEDFKRAARRVEIFNGGVNVNEAIEVHYTFGAGKRFDSDNLVKSAQDNITKHIFGRANDNNIRKIVITKEDVAGWEQGYIHVTVKNVAT